jgi:hypothetical protein
MSPTRLSSQRNSSGGFKPYTRGVTPIVISNSVPDAPRYSPPPGHVERPGFPTYAQYKQVESAYLQSLTPRRQGKALISQALFDRIWDVLHQPEYQGETAQFRFWARKMFTISKTHRVTLGGPEYNNPGPQEVLLHDNLLVAIQEQLYDLLCYCHGSTSHGGRDKTCALIRKHYTWVPKDLVSNFIKVCPTCIVKKCGNVDSTIASPVVIQQPQDTSAMRSLLQNFYEAELSAASSSSNPTNGIPWPSLGSPRDDSLLPAMLENDPLEASYREAFLRSRALRSLSATGVPTPRGLHSLPMSREVSLYKGLPNGWQYRHNDYATAHSEFMKMKDLPLEDDISLESITASHSHRPRVPSIVPLWGPDQFPHPEFQNMQETDLGNSEHISSLDHTSGQMESPNRSHSSDISLQYLIMAAQQNEDKSQDYMHQIDPILLEMTNSGASGMNEHAPDGNVHSAILTSSESFPSSTSMKRATAPLHINLDFPTEKTFQAFLAYRDSLGEGNITPDSPLMNAWHPGNPSPASSDSSSCSQSQLLSPFPSNSASTSPGSSALTTPVDECDSQGGSRIVDVKGKRRQDLLEAGAAQELSDNIQAACGL